MQNHYEPDSPRFDHIDFLTSICLPANRDTRHLTETKLLVRQFLKRAREIRTQYGLGKLPG